MVCKCDLSTCDSTRPSRTVEFPMSDVVRRILPTSATNGASSKARGEDLAFLLMPDVEASSP